MYADMAQKMAKVMTEYSQPVNPGDIVVISGSSQSEEIALALYEAVLKRGGHPHIQGGYAGVSDRFLKYGSDEQLQFLSPIDMAYIENVNIFYSIWATINTKAMSRVDPEKMSMYQLSQKPLRERWEERELAGDLRWCILPWPTQAMAQEAEMSLLDYTNFVYKACALDKDDPTAHWQSVQDKQLKLVDYLNGKQSVVVEGPDIELSLSIADRTWVSAHGNRNFPDGEVYTGPVEDSVNGRVKFNLPTNYGGRQLTGVSLEFKDGKVVDASAEKGEDFLLSQLDTDEGARFLGEFAIGTNWGIQEVTGSTLFDEKIGGTMHMALGLGLPNTGNTNKSVVHWDMVHDMKAGGRIFVDDELIYENGEFTI